MAYNLFRMRFVMCTLAAPALSQFQLLYTVSSHFPARLSSSFPIYLLDAHNVCTRAKNHYDPQQVNGLFSSDMAGTEDTPDRAMVRRGGRGSRDTARDRGNDFRSAFQQAHERQASRMYFV